MADDPKAKPSTALPDDNEPHPTHPGLTKGDVRKAQARAAAKVEAARKKAALERIEHDEEEKLRAAMGETNRTEHITANLRPDDKEIVEITLNLPPHMLDVRLDGVIYQNGKTIRCIRAIAKELLYVQSKGWEHESARMGEDRFAFYAQQAMRRKGMTVINGLTGATRTEGAS